MKTYPCNPGLNKCNRLVYSFQKKKRIDDFFLEDNTFFYNLLSALVFFMLTGSRISRQLEKAIDDKKLTTRSVFVCWLPEACFQTIQKTPFVTFNVFQALGLAVMVTNST